MKQDAVSFGNINSSEVQLESIEEIYNRLVNAAIVVSAFVAFIVTAAALFREVAIGHQNTMLLPVSSVLVTFAFLFFLRRLSYNIRALIIPGALFIWGSIGLFRFGLIGMGIPTLITSCILLTIFFGSRFGLVALAISLFVIALVGVGIQLGQVDFKFDMNSYAVIPYPWILAAGCVIYYIGLIVVTLGRLHVSLGDAISFLNKRTLDLRTTNEQLKAEISERKQAEEALRQYEHIVSSSTDMLALLDKRFYYIAANKKYMEAFELTPEQMIGNTVANVFGEEFFNAVIKPNADRCLAGEEVNYQDWFDFPAFGRRFMDVTYYPYYSQEKEIVGFVVNGRNITERKRTQEMMIQTEKMMSVGGLAAGIAHEINNPLAGIIQNVQVIKNRMLGDQSKNISTAEECGTTMEAIGAYMDKREISRMIDSIMESGKRAAKIVDNILSFSRKSDSQFGIHDLGELLDKTLELAESDYDLKNKFDFRQIEISREYDDSIPNITCEASQIQQVFLNILKNGAHVMIESKVEKQTPRFILRLKREGGMVRVEIEDNGPGMDEITRKRIFEPFYTTKPVGAGTGLGLSVSYFIITENHSGTIEVKSSPGMGANFIIRLPIERKIH